MGRDHKKRIKRKRLKARLKRIRLRKKTQKSSHAPASKA